MCVVKTNQPGRDEKVWPEALKVIPERWESCSPTAFEFPVFQAGPRICLGLRMVRSLVVSRTVVRRRVTIIRCFSLWMS